MSIVKPDPTVHTTVLHSPTLLEIGGKIKAIEGQCKTDEDWVKHDEELKELRKQLIKLAEQETRAQGRGYAVGIPIAIFCAVSYFLPF